MKNFVRSPLATSTALTASKVDALDIVFSDEQVQRAAGRLHLKRQRLLENAGYRSAISEAVAAADDLADVTPEQIVAVLARLAGEADDEIAAVREDHALHDARHKARMHRLMPLRRAVSARVTALSNERDHGVMRLDCMHRSSTMGGAVNHRHANLIAAGLTIEEIASLGPAAQDPAQQEGTIRARMAEIDAELVPLRDFLANESDVTPLAGLGFDKLLDERHAAEQVPA